MASENNDARLVSYNIKIEEDGIDDRGYPQLYIRYDYYLVYRPFFNESSGKRQSHSVDKTEIVISKGPDTLIDKETNVIASEIVEDIHFGSVVNGGVINETRKLHIVQEIKLRADEMASLYRYFPNTARPTVTMNFIVHLTEHYNSVHEFTVNLMSGPYFTIPKGNITFERLFFQHNPNNSASGGNSNFQYYIKGKSKMHGKLARNSVKDYGWTLRGSSIEKFLVTVDGVTYTVLNDVSYPQFDTDFLRNVGSSTVSIVAVDTRGYQYPADNLPTGDELDSVAYTVYDYAEPTLSSLSAYRSDSEGIQAADGTYIAMRATETHSSVGGNNTVSFVARYKPTSGSFGSDITLQNNTQLITGAGLISTTSAYLVEIEVTDTAGFTATFQQFISSALAVFSVKDGGKSVGVGMYVDTELDNTFHVSFDTYMHGDMYLGETKLTEAQLIALLNLIQEV